MNSYIDGRATLENGTFEERVDFLFALYDVDRNGTIERSDLTTLMLDVAKQCAMCVCELDRNPL